ncbi:MAG: hydrolase 1, exosortase A system-associated [Burkholderiales bacterium]|nr:hydrolase 1, exosortase A system-associated [Burkholderiales bacterium]MDR4518368.1 hydrolase 1, exosortase A system-associated [Nitrosomonas sp.]
METPISFKCEDCELLGILNVPDTFSPRRGVVFIVADGPQYRVGAQRQFVTMARTMEKSGYATLRFDYRGMGDSEGIHRGFEYVNEDIKAAVDALLASCTSIEEVVLWGECDSAAAVLFYAHTDTRVKGVCIANPWVRTEEGRAKTIVKHYYQSRLVDKKFWKKLLSGQFEFRNSLVSLWNNIIKVFRAKNLSNPVRNNSSDSMNQQPLPSRLAYGLGSFDGQVLLILSGNDWIAKEFLDMVAASPVWQNLLNDERLVRHEIQDADHSFSRKVSRDELLRLNLEWLKSW